MSPADEGHTMRLKAFVLSDRRLNFTSYSAKPQMCASKTTQGLKIFLCVCRSVKEELAR